MVRDPDYEADPELYLLAQVRESFGRVVYSHKTHEKEADICFFRHRVQQWFLVGLTAISSGTFLAAVLGLYVTPELASLATSFIALLVTAASLSAKTFRFAEEANSHREVASQLWDIRESYISLISDVMSGKIDETNARARRSSLQEATYAAYSVAPRTSPKAFSKASEGLKNNEEMTFSAHEIDLFLPEALRLTESKV